jgi:hypothetical protein
MLCASTEPGQHREIREVDHLASAGAFTPDRSPVMRPFWTTMVWLAAAVPAAGSMRASSADHRRARPARAQPAAAPGTGTGNTAAHANIFMRRDSTGDRQLAAGSWS